MKTLLKIDFLKWILSCITFAWITYGIIKAVENL
jgi:hypothetical protein